CARHPYGSIEFYFDSW
nr:immunoglobulin heavy chain junction region [Macaca mulatta]